jgi:C-methyltransferase
MHFANDLAMNDPLKGLFTQYWLYLVVRAACRLNLFEAVRDQSATEAELHEMLRTDSKATRHLIGALLHHGYLRSDNDRLELTQLSERLTEDHPQSMKYACLMWGGEHMDVWQQLDTTISSGKPVFNSQFGMPFFEFLVQNPVHSDEYHRAMFEYARDDYRSIAEKLHLASANSILDVGGANGALALEIQNHHPEKQVTIFDIEDRRHLTAKAVPFVQGDFFTLVPKMADTIVLSRVLHDWPDDKASTILRNCADSLPENGKVFVIENDLSRIGDGAHLLSLNMMAVCESFERSNAQYTELLEQSGFRVTSTSNHNHLIIIEAWKA